MRVAVAVGDDEERGLFARILKRLDFLHGVGGSETCS